VALAAQSMISMHVDADTASEATVVRSEIINYIYKI
jgi:hypothetical protein